MIIKKKWIKKERKKEKERNSGSLLVIHLPALRSPATLSVSINV